MVSFLLFKKRKYLVMIYTVNFLSVAAISSYSTYSAFFYTKEESKEILKQIERSCEEKRIRGESNAMCKYYDFE